MDRDDVSPDPGTPGLSPARSAAMLQDLEQAVLDASSMIYMLKAGFLDRLSFLLDLATPAEVAAETGWPSLPVRVVRVEGKEAGDGAGGGRAAPDDLLLRLAGDWGWPVVSEDRELLMRAEARDIRYFNSLMMLLLLNWRGRCSAEEYRLFQRRLYEIGRYSAWVRSFAEAVARELGLPRDFQPP